MKRKNILTRLGYTDVMGFKEFLQAKNTKTNEFILGRINLKSEYVIMSNNETVTVISDVIVTKKEIGQLERFTNKKYMNSGRISEDNDLWFEWIGKKELKVNVKEEKNNIEKLQKELGKHFLPR